MVVTTHNLGVQQPWFDFIANGKKTVEGRIGNQRYREIKADDQIRFENGDQSVLTTVVKVESFANLREFFKAVGLQNALPGVDTIEEGIQIYEKFYKPEDIQKEGFLGIFIKVVK